MLNVIEVELTQEERMERAVIVAKHDAVAGRATHDLIDALTADIAVGEHLNLSLSGLDRQIYEESIVAGDKAIVGHEPTPLTPWHRYGMRLARKYGKGKDAFLLAYMLVYVASLDKETKRWIEDRCDSEGFESGFKTVFGLFKEMRKLDADDSDVLGKIFNSLAGEMSYHSMPIVPSVNRIGRDDDGNVVVEYLCETAEEKVDPQTALYREFADRIRRAGVHQLGGIGKELYARGKEMGYELTKDLWEMYRTRKVALEVYKKVN